MGSATDWVKQYSGYNIANDLVHGNGKAAVQDMSKNDVVGNALGLPHIGDDPAAADTSGVTAAQKQDSALSTQFGNERQSYQPMTAPQIGAYAASPPGPLTSGTGGARPNWASVTPTGPSGGAQPIPNGLPAGPGAPPPPPNGTFHGTGNPFVAQGVSATQGTYPGAPPVPPSTTGSRIAALGGGAPTPGGNANPMLAGSVQSGNDARQQGALNMLQGAAAGTTPSAAEIQSNQQLGTAMANQMALASAMQGRHPGAAFNAAARGAANVQGQVIGQGALDRATEQANARNAYAQAVGGARGQDVQTDVANLNAKLTTMGYDEQTRNALLEAQLKSQGMSDDMVKAVLAANTAAAQAKNAQNAQYFKMGSTLLAA